MISSDTISTGFPPFEFPTIKYVDCSLSQHASEHSTHRRPFVVVSTSSRTASSDSSTSQRISSIHSQQYVTSFRTACSLQSVTSGYLTRRRFFVVVFTRSRIASSDTTLQWTSSIHFQQYITSSRTACSLQFVMSGYPACRRFFLVVFTSSRTASSNPALQWAPSIHSQQRIGHRLRFEKFAALGSSTDFRKHLEWHRDCWDNWNWHRNNEDLYNVLSPGMYNSWLSLVSAWFRCQDSSGTKSPQASDLDGAHLSSAMISLTVHDTSSGTIYFKYSGSKGLMLLL